MKIVIVGAGRAGTSLARAFTEVGHDVTVLHHDEVRRVPEAEAVLLCVPDDAIATVASSLPPTSAVVVHVAGSRGLDVLAPHARVASLHPLVAMPTTERGAERLHGAVFAVAGDDVAESLARSLQGRIVRIADELRAGYHAAACVAANHLVTLLASVRDVAESVGLELEDFLPLAAHALQDVRDVGPERALTGPASRGDLATIDAHLAAIPESQRALYVAMAREALALGERRSNLPA